MARGEKFVELYNPDGTRVEVGEDRAEILMSRGFTKSKPRKPTGPVANSGDSPEVAALKQQLADAEKQRDEALQAATDPKVAEPVKANK